MNSINNSNNQKDKNLNDIIFNRWWNNLIKLTNYHFYNDLNTDNVILKMIN